MTEGHDKEGKKFAFDLGELVQLKSGGPPMTIGSFPDPDNYSYQNEYHCVWFKGASKEAGYFAEHLLQPFVAPKK